MLDAKRAKKEDELRRQSIEGKRVVSSFSVSEDDLDDEDEDDDIEAEE